MGDGEREQEGRKRVEGVDVGEIVANLSRGRSVPVELRPSETQTAPPQHTHRDSVRAGHPCPWFVSFKEQFKIKHYISLFFFLIDLVMQLLFCRLAPLLCFVLNIQVGPAVLSQHGVAVTMA